jgi:hypothetical protein
MRIRDRMVDQPYADYVRTKERLIREMDARPVPIRSPRRLPPIAQIAVSEMGLRDPKNRYREQQLQEDRVSRVVNAANGIEMPERPAPTAKSVDYEGLAVLHQTRFFFGKDPELGNRKGQKVFEGSRKSKVGEELSAFADR